MVACIGPIAAVGTASVRVLNVSSILGKEEDAMFRLTTVGVLGLVCALLVNANPAQAQNVWQEQLQAMQSQMKELQRQMNEMVEANKGRPAGAMSKDEIADLVREQVSLMQKDGKLPAKPGAKDFRVYWKDGFRFDSTDGTFKLKFGGRIMSDWTWADAGDEAGNDPSVGEEHSGHELRRARLYVAGTVYDEFEFKAQYDFAHHLSSGSNSIAFKDMYIGIKPNVIKGVPGLRFGHFKEPFSLEELTSSKYITFIERSMADSMAPGRNVGVMIHNAHLGGKKHERMTYAVGFFRNTDNGGYGRADGSYAATGRITFLPLYVDKGKYLVHVGGAVSYRDLGGTTPMANETARFRTRPENHLTGRYVDTGAFNAENATLYNAEAAVVAGPFSVQSEYTFADVSRRRSPYGSSDPSFSAYYVQASCFLTPGDRRRYKNSAGAFSRVKPVKPFSLKHGGFGAWQAAVRYSHVDFADQEIRYGAAGTENNWTFGLNWHWNNNIRMMFNYVLARPRRHWMTSGGSVYRDTGRLSYAMVRAQIDF